MFKIPKYLNGYIVIIVVMDFCNNFSVEVSWYFCNYSPAQNNSSIQLCLLIPIYRTQQESYRSSLPYSDLSTLPYSSPIPPVLQKAKFKVQIAIIGVLTFSVSWAHLQQNASSRIGILSFSEFRKTESPVFLAGLADSSWSENL